ncbi:ABC transporter permease [Ignisphaera sp. 4213-co]|uniref:ABC transporter permease n=1 Tax=Ignisphaera cupida TaxID=3050454 RepID=A0ABD4Z5P5_9CREN|nr:ABC transporter permease [Ignisphaera sp. 4213-co]MDK6028230.1 ABC transporter permease [Ignisphaera sp. 4213-co]
MMWWLIAKSIAKTLTLILLTTATIYLVARAFPGDPITVLYGEQPISDEVRKAVESRLGLDKPLYLQILIYWRRVFTGDWGVSTFFAKPVFQVVFQSFINSLKLAVSATVLTTLVCVLLAYLSMAKGFKMLSSVFPTLSSSMPAAVWGVVLMVFAAYLKIPIGFGSMSMPLLTLVVAGTGVFYRILQSLLEKTFSEPFVEMYKAFGMSIEKIFLKALRYAMPVYLTATFYRMGLIIAGAMATEVIFAYPGMGLLLVQAFSSRDYPVLIGWTTIVSVTLSVLNMVSDILHIYMDPRLRGVV